MNKKTALLLIPTLLAMAACNVTATPSSSEGGNSSEAPSTPVESSENPSTPTPSSENPSTPTPSSENPSTPTPSTSSENPSTPTPSSESKFTKDKKAHPWVTEPVTIRWDNTFSYDSQIGVMIEDFKKLEPNVTIENNKKSGAYDLLETDAIKQFATNDYASIITAYGDHVANYIDYGKAVNFEKYMYGEYGWTEDEYDDIVESYLDEGRCFSTDGMYLMPQSKSTEPMYYNAKILGKTIPGINGNKPITEDYINRLTWEELFDNFCPKFIEWNAQPGNQIINLDSSTYTDTKFGAVVGIDSDDNLFITLAQQYGIPYTSFDQATGYGSLDFDNQQMKDLLIKWKGYYDKGYIMTSGTTNSRPNYAFQVNQCLFSTGSTGGLKYQLAKNAGDFTTNVAFMPQAKNGAREAIISQGPGVAILDHGENANLAAWAFIKFMMEPKNTLYWASETGYAPVCYSVYEESEYLEICDPTRAADNEAALKAKVLSFYDDCKDALFVSPAFKGSSKSRSLCGGLLTKVLLNADGLSGQAYNDWVATQFTEVLNTAKKELY